MHTENKELDTFLHKTAGLQLGQKPARMSDKDMEVDSRTSQARNNSLTEEKFESKNNQYKVAREKRNAKTDVKREKSHIKSPILGFLQKRFCLESN